MTNCSFVVFQIWDLPGHLDYFDSTFDSEKIFGGCGALIFVIDAQVSDSFNFIQLVCLFALGFKNYFEPGIQKKETFGCPILFLAPLAVGQRAYVMVRCPPCVRPSVNFFFKHLLR